MRARDPRRHTITSSRKRISPNLKHFGRSRNRVFRVLNPRERSARGDESRVRRKQP